MSFNNQLSKSDETLKQVMELINNGQLRKGLNILKEALKNGDEYTELDLNRLNSKLGPDDNKLFNKFYHHFIRIYLKQEKWNLAIELLKNILNTDKDYKSYLLLGDIYKKQNMLSEALENYLEAIQINSRNSVALKRLKQIIKSDNFNIDEWRKLENLHYKLVEMDPNNTFAYLNLGDILTRNGKLKEAVKCYRTVCYKNNLATKPGWVLENWDNKNSIGPNFIIIGVRKCGTTSLYHYVKQHPQVLQASRKEIKFFNDDERFKLGTKWYLSHFPPIPVASDFITGEASPLYFFKQKVAKRLARKFSDVKLLLILRNPVDRAISEFHFKVRRGNEFKDIRPVIESELNSFAGIENLAAAKKRNNDTRILLRGLYVYDLQRWMDYFPKEQLLILKTEDLAAEPGKVMHDVFNFLEIPSYHDSQYEIKNTGKYDPIEDDLRLRLEEFYNPHNKKLEEFLGINFNWN
jgi:hypothetical protein